MKVLFLGSVYPRFHSDTQVPWLRRLVAHLVRAGVEVQVMAPSYRGLESHTIDGVPVYRFRYATPALEILTHDEGAATKMTVKPWMQLLAIPYCISGFFKCIRLAHRERFDVIHAHWPFPHALIAFGACKLFHIPLVLNFYGVELLLLRKKKWIRPFMKFIIGQGNAIVAISHFTAARIREVRDCEVEWIPYGTTLSRAATFEVHPHIGKYRILFVGRHIERKGLEYLIRAAGKLDSNHFEVRIAGTGDLTPSLQNLARSIAPETVVFTGLLSPEALETEYKTANCFVLPAIVDSKGDTEGLGVVLIEAMEYGLPVIASDVGGIPDVVIHEKTGLLVPEKDVDALVEAFERMAADVQLNVRLLQGAEAHVRECFDWDKIVAKQVAIYASCSGSSN
jgi:glycosyltransferase involved in cell wall biosynthesis